VKPVLLGKTQGRKENKEVQDKGIVENCVQALLVILGRLITNNSSIRASLTGEVTVLFCP
jgi:hypothetical protein